MKYQAILTIIIFSLLNSFSIAFADDVGDQLSESQLAEATKPTPDKQGEISFNPSKRKLALGFTLDLLPIAMSAATGNFGMAGQTWVGIDHLKIRLVGGHMHMPDFLAGGDGFENQSTTVTALIFDYVFGDDFDGWWVGTGFEYWMSEIEHENAPGQKASWENLVWTVGGGYIWKFYDNLYLNPWVAAHVFINDPEISLAGKQMNPMPISGEVSLKIGYHFDL